MIKDGKSIKVILRRPLEYYYQEGMISYRALNVCKAFGIVTVGDLIRYHHEGNLLKLRNCGPYTIQEFENVIGLVNYKYAVQLLEKLDSYQDLPEKLKEIIVEHYKRPLIDFSLDCIKLFYDTFGDSKAFYTFFFCNQKDLCERFNGLKSRELKHYCYQLLSDIHSSFRKEGLDDTYTYELVVMARAIIWFCDETFAAELQVKDPTLAMRRRALVTDFENRAEQHLGRYDLKEVRQKLIPTYLKALGLFQHTDREIDDLWYKLSCWRYSHRVLTLLIAELKETLFWYEGISGDELGKSIVANNYRYLTEEQACFVAGFHKKYGYYPMFFLLREHLMNTTDKFEWTFAKATGIYDGKPKTLEEIGKEMGYSKPTVRSYYVRAPRYLFRDKGWLYYKFLTDLVIPDVDELYKSVVENEKVNIPFESFAKICTDGFGLKLAKVNDKHFFVNDQLHVSVIYKACSTINAINNRIKGETCSIPLGNVLDDAPVELRGVHMKALPVIISKAYGLAVDENQNIIFQPQGIDVIYEATEILRKKGKPMGIEELYKAFIKRRPEAKDMSMDYFKGKISRAETIKPIGKSMRYALTEWEHVYRGTIRQLVADVLKEAKTPLHIDKIMKKVLKVYPNTNKRSVKWSLKQDEARFVLFGEGVYGLVDKQYSKKFEAMRGKREK